MSLEELEKKMAELEKLQAETENAYAELKAQIAELKTRGEEKPEPPHPRWKPEYKEHYYIVWCNGAVEETYWGNGEIDNGEYSIGNIFRTKAEAEFAAESLKVLAEMREWAGNYNDGYSLIYDIDKKRVCYTPASERLVFGEMRFTTGADAEECIEAIGAERLMRYYFGIPEEETNNG